MAVTKAKKHGESAEFALVDVANGIQESLNDGNQEINVFTMPARMQIVNEFALLFAGALFESIEDYNLSRNDVRVILKIIIKMQFGNLIRISWADIGNELNIDKSNMPRHIKKLRESGLIIEDKGSLYLNPQVIAKGKFLQKTTKDNNRENLLNIGAKALEERGKQPSILTKEIKSRQRKKSQQEKQEDYDQYSLLDD